jgi:hypothetical protein
MLFYERVQTKLNSEDLPPKPLLVETCKNIYEKIWEENLGFIIDKNVFDTNYTNFIVSVFNYERVNMR